MASSRCLRNSICFLSSFPCQTKVILPDQVSLYENAFLALSLSQNLYKKFFNLFIFNRRIIGLQYCVGFCHTSTRISHRNIYVSSLLALLPTLHPILPLCVATEHWFELPESCSKFPLANYFPYGSVYVVLDWR